MLRARYRAEFATTTWRFDRPLLIRLLRFGMPNGLGSALDPLVFAFFTQFVGQIGPAALAATSITFVLNMIVILPTLGVGQAVEVLVGRRLGEGRPEVAARSAWTGLAIALAFTTAVAVGFLLFPDQLTALFEGDQRGGDRAEVVALVPVLLRFVVVYCLFDAVNVVFSFALRGAGDTRFVTMAVLVFAWPSLVLPTWAAVKFGWGLYWAWSFASLYIILLAVTYLFRFLQGRWRDMRVIERSVEPEVVGVA
jgi:MATE family multidrug resistance protein